LFSKSQGKFAAIAKGARKGKAGAALGSVSPPSLIEAIVYFKSSRSVQILGQVSLINGYSAIKKDLTLMSYASAMLQITERSLTDGEANPQAFETLNGSLCELGANLLNPRIILWVFELYLLKKIGFWLNPFPCPVCGNNLAVLGAKNYLLLDEGSVCCTTCDPGNKPKSWISGESVSILRLLSGGKRHYLENLKPSKRAESEITQGIEKFLKYHHQSIGELTALKLLDKLE
jgi:DNA repair protein RecO